MRLSTGRLTDISLDPAGRQTAWIECPPGVIPNPGRYCLLTALDDQEAILPVTVFSGEVTQSGFMAVGELPGHWLPGASLRIRGPLGKGFTLPSSVYRLALVAAGETPSRLMPLAHQAASNGADVAWFTDISLPGMPPAYELNPLNALVESLAWADFIAMDIPTENISALPAVLGLVADLPSRTPLPPGQVLVKAHMPCGGLSECGACALSFERSWQLTCQHGPVFNLESLVK